ncbi:GNAT family N-acetyltransferase [Myxococcus sp. RHSTA-1-4]|uniref:GNAT family N-acetyltransferase n=1 Tax=Myxococcus sp. RHSTA-1-4 TaxID=2874601 RepID=UPI001CBAFD82|nr:GNAT family N-acetyltransferase [Myxococcus sp. RHSTA-1-4]
MEELPFPRAPGAANVSRGTRAEAGVPGKNKVALGARRRAMYYARQGSIRVSEVRDLAGFHALAREWNDLVARTDDQVFYRHEYVSCWLRHFAPEARLRILTGRDLEGRLVAVLPLRAAWGRQYGLPARQLLSLTNKHSCRFDLLAEDPKRAGRAFLRHLLKDRSWDMLRLADVPEGGAAFAMLGAASKAGLPCGTWESARSPYLLLPGTVDAWQRERGKNAKPLRRRRRRLEERGRVTLERVTGGERLAERLAEGFALERSGWKARRGTAIAQSQKRLAFYTDLARVAARAGWLGLYSLRLDRRAIAFQYGLEYGGRYLAMKPGYDESFAEVSPGQLLTEELIQDCIGRGLAELDLLGDEAPFKREWTETVRPHHWLFIYRASLRGRALYQAKFRWVPVARRMVAKWVRRR